MAEETPSWLQEDQPSGGGIPSEPVPVGGGPPMAEPPKTFSLTDEPKQQASPMETTTTSTSSGGGVVEPDPNSDLPKMIVYMRLFNMGAAVALVTCSILLMTSFPSIADWVLASYATCMGTLVCCAELQLNYLRTIIAMNFGFLFNALWRFVFYFIMASIAWAFGNLFGKVVAAVLVAVACFNVYVILFFPQYRQMRDQIAKDQNARLEARIQRELGKQVIKGVATGK